MAGNTLDSSSAWMAVAMRCNNYVIRVTKTFFPTFKYLKRGHFGRGVIPFNDQQPPLFAMIKITQCQDQKIWLHLALFQDQSYPSFPDHTQVVQQTHEVTRAFSLRASRFVNRTQRLTALVLIIPEHISVQFETLDVHRLITCVQVKSGNLMVELKYVKMECRLIESV